MFVQNGVPQVDDEHEEAAAVIEGSAKFSKNKIHREKQTVTEPAQASVPGVTTDPFGSAKAMKFGLLILQKAKEIIEAHTSLEALEQEKAALLNEIKASRARGELAPREFPSPSDLQDTECEGLAGKLAVTLDIAMAEAREQRESLKRESEQAETRTNCLEADLENRTQELQRKDLLLEQAKAQLQLLKQESDASEKRLREELQNQVEQQQIQAIWWWQTVQQLQFQLTEAVSNFTEFRYETSRIFHGLQCMIATLEARLCHKASFSWNPDAAVFFPENRVEEKSESDEASGGDLFSKMDKDGSGGISHEEFAQAQRMGMASAVNVSNPHATMAGPVASVPYVPQYGPPQSVSGFGSAVSEAQESARAAAPGTQTLEAEIQEVAAGPPPPAQRQRCLNRHCTYLAHVAVEEYEGYCCKACAKWEKEGYKRKTHHGLYCKKEPAGAGCNR